MLSVGVVQYLNSLPFIAPYLLNIFPSPFDWVRKPPQELNQLMLEKKLPLSFMSSVFYLEHQDQFQRIPEIGIGADGAVGSVCLFHPEQMTHFNGVTIALDRESATSNGILKWYIEKIRGERAFYVTPEIGAPPPSAFLLIGDKCLSFGTPDGLKKVDLAEEWKSFTNLPIPFAVFAAQKEFYHHHRDEVEKIKNHLLTGVLWSRENPKQIAECAKRQSALPEDKLMNHLKQLRYHFDSRYDTALSHLERDVLKRVQKKGPEKANVIPC